MGSATWTESALVDGSPDAVFAWMTDFTADDHSSEAFRRGAGVDPNKKPKPSKRILLARNGNVLKIKDEYGSSGYTSTVTIEPAARTVRIQGGMGYDATWRASAEGAGTRVSVEGKLGRGLIGSMMKLFEGKMRKGMAQDFNGHLEDLRETLRAEQKRA